jgi:Ca2+-binding EF-hand superfamily protein
MEWDQVFAHPIFKGHFDQFRANNKKIEDKLKVVMNGLRFKINSENIDIGKLFSLLGFNPGSELSFHEFHKFLDYISPKITEEEVRFFFDKVDADESGSISIEEIEGEMAKHNITVDRGSKLKKANTMQEDEEPQLSEQLAEKAKRCFERLFRVLNYKKISLKKTFHAYDKEGQGNLTFDCFKNMISRLDSSFTEDDIISIFDAIDVDHSKTIEFDELNAYYCKVNGLPFSL